MSTNTELPNATPKPAMTPEQVAKIIGCSKTHVFKLIHGKIPNTPRLPSVRTGHIYRIRTISLNKWLEECERWEAAA